MKTILITNENKLSKKDWARFIRTDKCRAMIEELSKNNPGCLIGIAPYKELKKEIEVIEEVSELEIDPCNLKHDSAFEEMQNKQRYNQSAFLR